MRPPRSVKVYPHEVKPGDEYTGYVSGDTHCFTSITVSPEGVPLQWGDTPIERKIDYFERDMTWEEQAAWYRNAIDMQRQPSVSNLSRLNRIATLLARYLRLTPIITDDSSRLATVGWLNLNQTGFPPVRLIALSWAHNSNLLLL